MLKCDFLIIGDNYFGLDAAINLSNKGNSVIYTSARILNDENDYLIEAQFLRNYISINPKFDLIKFNKELKQSKLVLQKKLEYHKTYKQLTILRGQPELNSQFIAGIHNFEHQELIKFKKCLYLPSARNFIVNNKIEESVEKNPMDLLISNLGIKQITIYSDKIVDIQLAFDICETNTNVTLITSSNLIEDLKIKQIKPSKLKLLSDKDIKIINKDNIITTSGIIKLGKLFYNYNSLVNHYYYRLNESLLNTIQVYGDSLNQNLESYQLNFKERYQANIWSKLYDVKEYDVNLLSGTKTLIQYQVRSRVDEIEHNKTINISNLIGDYVTDRYRNILGFRFLVKQDDANYYINRMGTNFKEKDFETNLKE